MLYDTPAETLREIADLLDDAPVASDVAMVRDELSNLGSRLDRATGALRNALDPLGSADLDNELGELEQISVELDNIRDQL